MPGARFFYLRSPPRYFLHLALFGFYSMADTSRHYAILFIFHRILSSLPRLNSLLCIFHYDSNVAWTIFSFWPFFFCLLNKRISRAGGARQIVLTLKFMCEISLIQACVLSGVVLLWPGVLSSFLERSSTVLLAGWKLPRPLTHSPTHCRVQQQPQGQQQLTTPRITNHIDKSTQRNLFLFGHFFFGRLFCLEFFLSFYAVLQANVNIQILMV